MAETTLVKHADHTNFDAIVLAAPRPVLVDFWVPWCGPCKAIGPVLEDIAQVYGDRLDVVKVNVDESREVAVKYGVRSIPTLILVRDGQILDTILGAMPKPKLSAFIDRHIG